MKNSTNSVENVKTILIVVLTVSAILLLYFLWKNETFDELRSHMDIFQETQKPTSSNPADFIVPESIMANIGTDSVGPYKSAGAQTNRYWKNFIGMFKAFSLSENIYVEEIKKEQWLQAKEMTSLAIDFGYSINFSSLCTLLEINKPSAYNAIESISTLLYSEGSKESIIVFDQKNNRYYRLAAMQNTEPFSSLIREIEGNEPEDYYYPMSEPLRPDVSNTCLIPVSMHTNMKKVSYETEIPGDEEERIREIAQIFFGKNFDFIRRIRETNHTTVFIYGYGEKILTSRANGSFEYKEEFSGSSTQESFHSALQSSVQYIDSHGGLGELQKRNVTVYLQDVQNIEQQKRKGYRFIFGLKKDGMPIYYENEDALIVEVIGNQVVYYKRYAILPEVSDETETDEEMIMGAIDVLLKNNANGSIREILIKSGVNLEEMQGSPVKKDEIQSFPVIADSIDAIRTGYLKTESTEELSPVWVFTAGPVDMYFDLYTGEMLGYTSKVS